MSQSANDHIPVSVAVLTEPQSVPGEDYECPPLITSQARLLDTNLIRQVLSGLLKPPPRITVKALVEQNLPAIRSARRRGWSIGQIADELASAGIPINEATLRKYLSLLDQQKPSVGRTSSKQTVPRPLIPIAAKAGDLPRRSLRRSAHLNVQLPNKGE